MLVACNKSSSSNNGGTAPILVVPTAANVEVCVTTGSGLKKLNKEANIGFNANAASSLVVQVDTTIAYQSIDGFGAALTGSSAYNLKKYKTLAERNAIYQDLFTNDGIGLKSLRISIGSSDFSTYLYSYDDMPTGQTDVTLANFSIAKDVDTLVSVLKEILLVNPSISIIASPWSAPAWMKSNGNMRDGGSLLTNYYSVYADYLVKYLKAMQLQNVNIAAITVQNEPRTTNTAYPTMLMAPTEQISFIKILWPKIQAANLTTKIYCGDNNWNGFDYSNSVLADATARQYVDGAAFHGYAGTPSNMSSVQTANPDKGIYFTEYTGVFTQSNFSDNLMSFSRDYLVENTRNWAKKVVFWNLVLDQNSGPEIKGGSTCRGVLTFNNPTGAVTKNEEYYALGQIAKFVQPLAKRIESSDLLADQLYSAAFKNIDGSKVLMVVNAATTTKTFDVKMGSIKFTYTLTGASVATFKWN